MYTKKSLGQHFLRSEKALRSIVDAGEVCAQDLVLEIGPGEGVLTDPLLKLAAKVIAVEKDNDLYERLKAKYARQIAEGRLDLINGDILDFDPNLLKLYKDFDYKLIANIPYNITGAILEKFLSADYQPELLVLLVQKEVCARIVAKDKKESILSISVKAYGTPHYVETVKAGSFVPAPNVDSAILSVTHISKDFFNSQSGKFSEKAFFTMLKAAFQAKRKKLSSNLTTIFEKELVKSAFHELKLDENVRAEDIPINTWQNLGNQLL